MTFKNVILVFLIYIKLCDCVKKYDNFTLYRVIPVDEKQITFLESLPDIYNAQLWKPPGLILRSVDFTISPEDKQEFLEEAKKSQLYLTTVSSNVQQLFDKQTVKTYIRRQMTSFDWRNYYRADDINAWLKDLAGSFPTAMNLFSIGKTVEGRPIFAARVIHSLYDRIDNRSTVIVEGGIHAREWISTAFVTFLLYKVLNAPADPDENFQRIAFAHTWVFVPLLNPDGYEYTHIQDRLWRKNRNNYGVDINRNFDSAFGSIGVSSRESSEIYCGNKAFSERESLAMKNLVEKYKDKLKYYIAFHSYGQYMIIPYAHLKEHVENYNEVKNLGIHMAVKIKRRYGTQYTVGTAYDTVGYSTSGVSGCWVKKAYNVPYVMTFELRDEGKEGFALSPKHIIPTCKETVDGLTIFLNPTKSDSIAPMMESKPLPDGSDCCCLKNVVLLLNFIFFITLCFDYYLKFH